MNIYEKVMEGERNGIGKKLDATLIRFSGNIKYKRNKALIDSCRKIFGMSYHATLILLQTGTMPGHDKVSFAGMGPVISDIAGVHVDSKTTGNRITKAKNMFGIKKAPAKTKKSTSKNIKSSDYGIKKICPCGAEFITGPCNLVYCRKCMGLMDLPEKAKCMLCEEEFEPSDLNPKICKNCVSINKQVSDPFGLRDPTINGFRFR